MNFKAEGIFNMNQRVNQFLKANPDINITRNRQGRKASTLLHPDKSERLRFSNRTL
jgi:hypothetical protein